MHLRLSIIAATAAATFAAAPSSAATSASAFLGPLTITLFDLNPTDNIAPGISFSTDNDGIGSYVDANTYNHSPGQSSRGVLYGSFAFDPVSASAMGVPTATATATLSGSGHIAGTSLLATGIALGAAPASEGYPNFSSFGAIVVAPNYSYQNFTITAGTLVVISAASVLQAEVTNSYDPSITYGFEAGSASTLITLSGAGAGGAGLQSSSDSRRVSTESTFVSDPDSVYGYTYVGGIASDSATMTVSFVNTSGADLTGQFYVSAFVDGYSYAQAVPEPGTSVLMTAGILAVGFMARRRN